MKWVRNIAVGMVVLFVLYLVLANWPASGSGSRVKLEGSTPTLSSCEKLIQDLLDKYDDRSPYPDEPGTSGFIDCPDSNRPTTSARAGGGRREGPRRSGRAAPPEEAGQLRDVCDVDKAVRRVWCDVLTGRRWRDRHPEVSCQV